MSEKIIQLNEELIKNDLKGLENERDIDPDTMTEILQPHQVM